MRPNWTVMLLECYGFPQDGPNPRLDLFTKYVFFSAHNITVRARGVYYSADSDD